jgi:hypothetical protein
LTSCKLVSFSERTLLHEVSKYYCLLLAATASWVDYVKVISEQTVSDDCLLSDNITVSDDCLLSDNITVLCMCG